MIVSSDHGHYFVLDDAEVIAGAAHDKALQPAAAGSD